MKKKLMILGAGIYQVPLIQKAKEMGIETIVLSIPGDYPGIAFADKFYPVDTRDYEAVLRLARQERIHGICTSGTDIAVRSIGYVCSRMGLAGITEEAACKATDKALMKEAFVSAGVSTAAYKMAETVEEAIEAAEELGYPVVVKAVDSSGSRGIAKACSGEEVRSAYEDAAGNTKEKYILVEEYIEAEEIGVDAFVGQETLEAYFPHEKFNYEINGRTIPVGHRFPFHGSEKLNQELEKQIRMAAKSLGMTNCPLNADVFIKDEKVWVIEIGGRSGATCIPELISANQGYNWYEKVIRAAMGEPEKFTGTRDVPSMAKLLFSPVEGKIVRIDKDELNRLQRERIYCQIDYTEGQRIRKMTNGTDRIGHVLMVTSQEKELDEALGRLRRCIWLDKGNLEELWEN